MFYIIFFIIVAFLIIILTFAKPPHENHIRNLMHTPTHKPTIPKSTYTLSINNKDSWSIAFWVKYLVPTDQQTSIIKINNTPFAIFQPTTRYITFRLYTNSGKFETTYNLTPIQAGPHSIYKHFIIIQNNKNLSIYEDTTLFLKNDPHQDMTMNSTTPNLNIYFVPNLDSVIFYNKHTYNYPLSQQEINTLYETEYQELNKNPIYKHPPPKNQQATERQAEQRGTIYTKNTALKEITHET